MAYQNGYNGFRTMKVKEKNVGRVHDGICLGWADAVRFIKNGYQYIRLNGQVYTVSGNNIINGKEIDRKEWLDAFKAKKLGLALWLELVA